MEPLLGLTDPFLGLSKVLIYGPSRDPCSGPPLYPQSQTHPLIRGYCPHGVDHNLKGRFLGPYQLGRGGKRVWAGRR
jgi:hypothetical protein